MGASGLPAPQGGPWESHDSALVVIEAPPGTPADAGAVSDDALRGVLSLRVLREQSLRDHWDRGRALRLALEQEVVCRAEPSQPGLDRCWSNLGMIHFLLGRPDEAVAYYARALEHGRQTGDRRMEEQLLARLEQARGARPRSESA